MSGDAIAILACLDLSDEEWDALDAELTEIETSAEMARLEMEMSKPPACANRGCPRPGVVRQSADKPVLCSACAVAADASRRPIGVAQRGGKTP